ncbi:MAG: hypothetical protein IJZ62_05930 [Clostridia bacterium]|nr:hypothetical protein [Clostridia bacterium]
MRIKGTDKINLTKIPTVRDLEGGDVFTLLSGDLEGEVMLCSSYDYFIRVSDGEWYDKCDYDEIPVKKINCCLIIEE